MSTLPGLRADLRAKLEAAGLHAFTTLPEVVTPPFVFVSPDQPYLDFGPGPETALAFGEVLVRHRLTAVVAAGANDERADDLDDLVVQLVLLDLDPHQVESVDEPGRLTINGQPHLAVSLHLTVPTRLEAP